MPFIIETFDKPGHQHVRQATRAEHLEFLDRHKALLLACGAKLDDDGRDLGGGLYVVALDSREEAHVRFYSDHASDAPTFAWADEPVVVSPGKRMTALAVERRWPIERW